MKVEIIIDPSAVPSLAARVASAPAPPAKGGRGAGAAPRNAAARPARRPRAPRPAKKTADDLDAEMAVSAMTTPLTAGIQVYRLIVSVEPSAMQPI